MLVFANSVKAVSTLSHKMKGSTIAKQLSHFSVDKDRLMFDMSRITTLSMYRRRHGRNLIIITEPNFTNNKIHSMSQKEYVLKITEWILCQFILVWLRLSYFSFDVLVLRRLKIIFSTRFKHKYI